MRILTESQLEQFDQDGFLILPNWFSEAEMAAIRQARDRVFAKPTDADIVEKGAGVVRTAMGLHQRDDTFANLVRHPRFVRPAQQIAGPELYVQQVKINVKAAFEGEAWQWHYDFATHHSDDGVPKPLALNLHVFLDDVTEHNGPLYFIPGSHKHGPARAWHDTESTSYPLWVVDRDVVAERVSEGGIVSAVGPAGTALIFGDCLIHGSPPNFSPWERAIFSLILNPVSNAYTKDARPEYKHHRDLTPVSPLSDDCLLNQAAAE